MQHDRIRMPALPQRARPYRDYIRTVGDLPAALHGLRIVGDDTIDDQQVECSDGSYRPLGEVLALPSVLLVTRVYAPADDHG